MESDIVVRTCDHRELNRRGFDVERAQTCAFDSYSIEISRDTSAFEGNKTIISPTWTVSASR